MESQVIHGNKTCIRKSHMDALRIAAVFMVLFNHTGKDGFVLFTAARDSAAYSLYLFISIFIRIAVPLFFMVSGALLLGRDEPFRIILKKRVLRFAAVLIAGSALIYLYKYSKGYISGISPADFAKRVYTGNITVPYWYLYSYLAYLLMLPFLRKLAKAMSNRDFILLFSLYFIVQSLQPLQFLIWRDSTGYSQYFTLFFRQKNIIFPLLGYYIEHRMPKRFFRKKYFLILAAAGMAAICICGALTHYRCVLTGDWRESTCGVFFDTWIFIPAAAAYFRTKLFFDTHKISGKLSGFLSAVSACTFGTYLFEYIYRNETKAVFRALVPYIHSLPACLIWIFAACLAGIAVTFILRKIPGIKKFL